jgi:dTDP-glucose pyrophosphorylase/CBS domain-containing protein
VPKVDITQLFLPPTATIGEAVATIDRSGRISLALMVDDKRRLINTISDGDVRRGLLAGLRLTDPADKLLPIKSQTPHPIPVTALAGTSSSTLLDIMRSRAVRQIPLMNESGEVVDIAILQDLLPLAPAHFRALVMAGGMGMRLRPLTEDVPKPMLHVGGRPVMERIIEQLRDVGVSDVNITTHHQAEKIVEHFGKGEAFGVNINYVNEESPLGTGGALGLIEPPKESLLVINGDILTQMDFRKMFAYHQEQKAEMTVAVRRYAVEVPYGVVQCRGSAVSALEEKPTVEFFVNAGIYLLEPCVFDKIPSRRRWNMTDLIQKLLEAGRLVASFPVCEYWLDIGQHADYAQAQADAANGMLDQVPRGGVF